MSRQLILEQWNDFARNVLPAECGEIQRTEKNALAVPRSAVLPNESREFEIFTVANNHAIRHTVKIGAENPNEIQVIANDLHEGDPVVILGNHELEDGMAVEIKK